MSYKSQLKTINNDMNFSDLVKKILSEEMSAGGEGSVFGPNVGSTASAFSGDNYAEGDARNVYGIYGGVLTRRGLKKNKKKKKRKSKKRKSK
jgi:hypothetical protein